MTESQKMLLDIRPVIREIFWISQCWNDHNFSSNDLIDKCEKISKVLLGESLKPRDVDMASDWLDRADRACAVQS